MEEQSEERSGDHAAAADEEGAEWRRVRPRAEKSLGGFVSWYAAKIRKGMAKGPM